MIQVETVSRMKDNHLVAHYLMASYCYYQLDESPMTDHAFDLLCQRLLERYPHIEHQHKQFINVADLRAGTCLLPYEKYPTIVKVNADNYVTAARNNTLAANLEPFLS